jgi:phenylacetic acid degradation operon negative regulatory protein
MLARSALFDLYGDHLRSHDGQARVAAVVRLLDPVGIAAPAVRTAISRMVMQGWLEPVTINGGPGYRTTERADRRLRETSDRVYRRSRDAWDGSWHLAVVDAPPGRSARSRLRADLGFLGYAEIADNVWVERGGAGARTARARDVDPDPTSAWDLDSLRAAYAEWPAVAEDLLRRHLARYPDEDESAFAARFHLVHEWRKFLFADPGLPDELLPPDWPGRTAAEVFAAEAERLRPGADRFVARCLTDGGGG